jgi:hypothetical protein
MELELAGKEAVELGWSWRPDASERLRLTDHQQGSLSKAFEDGEIALIKCEGVGRENFNQPDDAALVTDGRGCDGADSQLAADFGSDSGIRDGIVTPQGFS